MDVSNITVKYGKITVCQKSTEGMADAENVELSFGIKK